MRKYMMTDPILKKTLTVIPTSLLRNQSKWRLTAQNFLGDRKSGWS